MGLFNSLSCEMIYISGDYECNVAKPFVFDVENSDVVWCECALLLLYFPVYCETKALSSYRVMLNVRERQFTSVRK
jgi:hypothetical protein